MLTLYKYDELYQWDAGRALLITPDSEGATPTQIHFEYDGQALVQYPETDGDNTIVKIPNVCLMESKLLVVYEVVGEWSTVKRYKFHVREKSRPNDYVYDEKDILTWTQLDRRITAMAEAEEAAEAVRTANEEQRQSNEEARQTAESERVEAESGREEAENNRVTNESARQTAESGRDTAEAARQAAEEARVLAENGRVNAESDRAAEFSSWQDENSGTVASAREQAENAAQSAQNAESSASDAKASADAAKESGDNAASSASAASTSATNSASSALESATSAGAAKASADAASASESNAGDSATKAEKAKQDIVDMDVSATTLVPGSNATVQKNVSEDGSISLEFGVPRGADGVTPVKGEDYFTESDKNEIAQAVVNQIDPDSTGLSHLHTNKALLDSITESQVQKWDNDGAIYASEEKPNGLTSKDLWLRIIPEGS